jgi:integrase
VTRAKRQPYGGGSIHPHHRKGCPYHARNDVARCAKDGCRMRAVIRSGYTKTGGRASKTVTGKTEAEVKARLRKLHTAIARSEAASTRLTVKAWSEKWLRLRERRRRPGSHNADLAAVRNWIVPTIGHKRLSDLTPDDVRAVADAATAAGNSTSTARRYQATLTVMLKDALKERHPVPEHLLLVDPPAVALNDRQAFSTEDALKMLAVAVTIPHGSRWAVAFLQGLRPGECRGMTRDALDFYAGETGYFSVSWQLQALPYNVPRDRSSGFRVPDAYEVRPVKGALHLVRPKTKSGVRAYPMVPWARDALTHWLDIAPADPPGGLLWPMAANDHADRSEWRWMQDQAGVRHPSGRYYHRHESRHTTASLLLALRVPERVRVAIMGHATIASTETYEHVDDPQLREALMGVASRLQLTPPSHSRDRTA